MFPSINLSVNDIESSWAGLRPLIHEEGKSASELSRKDEIFVSESELISIAGGKLTGYRKMAERIVDLVGKKYLNRFEKEFDPIQTEHLVLSGGPFLNYKAVELYEKQIFQQLKVYGFSKKDANYLVHNYGKQTDIILDKFEEINEVDVQKKLLKAEIWFAVHHEMVCTPADFFMRRTGRLFFDIQSVHKHKNFVINEFKSLFNWDDELTELYTEKLNAEINLASTFS